MSTPRIGVVGPRQDDEVLALSRALRSEGARPRVVDLTGLPGAHRLELRDDSPYYDGRPLNALEAIYLRRLRFPLDEAPLVEAAGRGPEAFDLGLARALAERRTEAELKALIWSSLALLEAPIVNRLEDQQVHPRKVQHLRRLAAAGLPVPPLLATNEPESLAAFALAQGDDGAVLKPLRGILKTVRFTLEVPLTLSRRPVLAQRYVRGATIRVYAVAGEAVAAARLSNEGHVDSSVAPRPAELTELTEGERELVRRAARAARLPFTGLDLLRPAGGGEEQLLECNAAPMFANFCRRTGAEVARPLARYLIHRARGGATWEREP